MNGLVIDPEFKSLIPALSTQEFEQLKENILAEGIRDALVTWSGLLLDGHNRYVIAQELDLPFTTVEVNLPDRDAAILWIVRNQLGRRNLTPLQASYLRGRWYEQEKKVVTNPQGTNQYNEVGGQNDPQPKTAARIAATAGVSPRTIKRDFAFSQDIDAIAEAVGPEAKDAILTAEVRLTKNEVAELAKIAPEVPDLVAKVANGQIKITEAKRQARRQAIAEKTPDLPSDKYRVLYADPPWKYGNSGLDDYGHAERHYPAMSIDELCALNVQDMADHDAVLFVWVTSPLLRESFRVIDAWGFQYKTSFVWDKVKHNFGHYNSVRHELLLVCTRGSCTPDCTTLFDSVQSIERMEHSVKPEEFRNIIDTLYTHGRRIELFARRSVENWDMWGNENDTTTQYL